MTESLTDKPSSDHRERSIVLVGMMGAGKSSIGRRLAQRLDLPFIDADTEIEAAAGCSIPEIFERHGESGFRDGERRVIDRLLNGPVVVLATGGGAMMDPRTRDAIGRHGTSIWLRAELGILLERCLRRNTRPLLRQGDPRETLQRLLNEREPIYATADIVVDSSNGPHEVVVKAIIKALKDRREDSSRQPEKLS